MRHRFRLVWLPLLLVVTFVAGALGGIVFDRQVLLEQDAQGHIRRVPVQPTDTTTDLPVVVLVNGGTASSAEIVAGALHDAGRATIVGTTTFGTGTVLSEFGLSDGSVLLLATKKWLTPSGQVIWHRGIAPDVQVALPSDVIPLLPETEKA